MQHVLAVYDTEPENFPRLMELMQDMQEHGQVRAVLVDLSIESESCARHWSL
jgi:hypothetical protein